MSNRGLMSFDKFLRRNTSALLLMFVSILIVVFLILFIKDIEFDKLAKDIASDLDKEDVQLVQDTQEPETKEEDVSPQVEDKKSTPKPQKKRVKDFMLAKLVEQQTNIPEHFSDYMFSSDRVSKFNGNTGTRVISGTVYLNNVCTDLTGSQISGHLMRFAQQVANGKEKNIYYNYAREIDVFKLSYLKAEYSKDFIDPAYLDDDSRSIYHHYASLNSYIVEDLLKEYNKAVTPQFPNCKLTERDVKFDFIVTVLGGSGGISI